MDCIYSVAIKNGNDTCFVDVKEKQDGEKYITIVMAKRDLTPENTHTFSRTSIHFRGEAVKYFVDAMKEVALVMGGNK
jgi:hypothetical protein